MLFPKIKFIQVLLLFSDGGRVRAGTSSYFGFWRLVGLERYSTEDTERRESEGREVERTAGPRCVRAVSCTHLLCSSVVRVNE